MTNDKNRGQSTDLPKPKVAPNNPDSPRGSKLSAGSSPPPVRYITCGDGEESTVVTVNIPRNRAVQPDNKSYKSKE